MRKLLLLFLIVSNVCSAATWNIVYPRDNEELDARSIYPMAVLSLALSETGVRFTLTPSRKFIPLGRTMSQLKANREIKIIWSMTNKTMEEELLPVRIPIYKGLIGWRIFLIHSEYLATFSAMSGIEELRRYLSVQGRSWTDTKILQANGFEVVTSSDYGQLFEIVESDRAQFFPRSVAEIRSEVANPRLSKDLVVEPKFALRYPTAMYFFFNRKNTVLANLVKTGLERAIANGKFDRLFMQEHSQYLKQAKMSERVVFELENPILPSATPLEQKELWYDFQ